MHRRGFIGSLLSICASLLGLGAAAPAVVARSRPINDPFREALIDGNGRLLLRYKEWILLMEGKPITILHAPEQNGYRAISVRTQCVGVRDNGTVWTRESLYEEIPAT
jgi:hypothetical protein